MTSYMTSQIRPPFLANILKRRGLATYLPSSLPWPN